jgi:hypothetical protein
VQDILQDAAPRAQGNRGGFGLCTVPWTHFFPRASADSSAGTESDKGVNFEQHKIGEDNEEGVVGGWGREALVDASRLSSRGFFYDVACSSLFQSK